MKKMLALMLAVTLLMAWSPAMADGYSEMLAKAETYYASEDYTKAIASYQLAQKLQPDNVQAFLGEANVHIILKDYSAAASVISAALEINPVSSDAWRLKCKIDALLNDIPAFEQDAIFAEVCDADLSDICLMIASMYSSAGLYDKAASYFAMSDLASLSETEQEMYRKALVNSGNRETAEQLGLASSPIRNAALDTAFDSHNLTLVKTEFPTITAADFEFPDEMWEATGMEKPADPIAELNAYIPNATVTWLSLSPAGNSGILVADGFTGVCYYAGKYHIIFPSQARGVEDVNENLAKVFSTRLQLLLGEEGVVYSPDGRYAAIFNIQYTLMRAQFILDPIIIDLSTGEMFLTATYGNRLMKGEAGAVTTATFSSDGNYLYYMLYGNTSEYRTALYRYNIQEKTTELCYSGSDLNYYPYFSETGNGAFVILRDVRNRGEMAGVTSITYENGSWNGTEYTFDLPLQYWNCNRLMLSANSGYAFIPGRTAALDGSYYAFQCVRPDDDWAGLNQYYTVSKEGNQIQSYSAGEINSLFENWTNGSTQEGVSTFNLDMPFQVILTSALSPDGHYVLLNTVNYGSRDIPETSRHLYLVRIDDLAIKEVWGIDPSAIQVGALGANYRPVIEWNTDTLIIGTSDGIQAFKFKLQ